MADNLIIDNTYLNTVFSQVNQLWSQAKDAKHWVKGNWASPIHLDQSSKDFRVEAVTIGGNLQGWQGFNSNSITYDYVFSNNFSSDPVVTITYDGTADAVVSKIIFNSTNSNDKVTIKLTKTTSNAKWSSGEPFVVHLIAVGS